MLPTLISPVQTIPTNSSVVQILSCKSATLKNMKTRLKNSLQFPCRMKKNLDQLHFRVYKIYLNHPILSYYLQELRLIETVRKNVWFLRQIPTHFPQFCVFGCKSGTNIRYLFIVTNQKYIWKFRTRSGVLVWTDEQTPSIA